MAETPSRKGTPIADRGIPLWARLYLSPGQQGSLSRGLQWILLLYQQAGLDQSRINAAQRLYIACGDKSECWHNIRTLAAETHMSQTTLIACLEELAELGWIVMTAGRGSKRSHYQLAWPLEDCLTSIDKAMCAQPTKKDGLCTTTAGKGTTHPGEGPCWRHGGIRANKGHASAGEPSVLQRLEQQRPAPLDEPAADEQSQPQPLEQGPVDKAAKAAKARHLVLQPMKHRPVDKPRGRAGYQPPLLQRLEMHAPTVDDRLLQPLENLAPTVGAEYVRESVTESVRGVEQDPPRSTHPGKQLEGRAPDGTMTFGDGGGKRATA